MDFSIVDPEVIIKSFKKSMDGKRRSSIFRLTNYDSTIVKEKKDDPQYETVLEQFKNNIETEKQQWLSILKQLHKEIKLYQENPNVFHVSDIDHSEFLKDVPNYNEYIATALNLQEQAFIINYSHSCLLKEYHYKKQQLQMELENLNRDAKQLIKMWLSTI